MYFEWVTLCCASQYKMTRWLWIFWEKLYFYKAAFTRIDPKLYRTPYSNPLYYISSYIIIIIITDSMTFVETPVEGALSPVNLVHIFSPIQISLRDSTCFSLPFLFHFLLICRVFNIIHRRSAWCRTTWYTFRELVTATSREISV